MIDKTPYVYLSKNANNLIDLIRGVSGIGDIPESNFLFSPTDHRNFISLESFHINSDYKIILKLIDPEGTFESNFINNSIEVNNKEISTYNIDNREYFLMYGIGSNYLNRSPIQRIQLYSSEIDVTKGRVLTLTFVESGSNFDATKMEKYQSNDPSNFNDGESKVFTDFGLENTTTSNKGKSIKTPISEEFYSLQDAILDCYVSALKNKYNTNNILLLLPDLSPYFQDTEADLNTLGVGSLLDNRKINDSSSPQYARLVEILNEIGIKESLPSVSLEDRIEIDTKLNPNIKYEWVPGWSFSWRYGLRSGSLKDVSDSATFNPSVSEWGDGRKLTLSVISDEGYRKYKAEQKGSGVAMRVAASVSRSISTLNSFGTSPPIIWKEFVEADYELAELFLSKLKDTDMIGGTITDISEITNDSPLVICGDTDLINYYLYNNNHPNRDKSVRSKYLPFLEDLVDSEEYTNIRYPIMLFDDTLESFRPVGPSLQNNIPSSNSSESFVFGKSENLTFSYGGKRSNLTSLSVVENTFYFKELTDHITTNYSTANIASLLKRLSDKEEKNKLVAKLYELAAQEEGSSSKDSIKSIINKQIQVNLSDLEATSLLNTIKVLYDLKKRNVIIYENPISETREFDYLIANLLNTSEFISNLSRQLFQITVKSLPLFTKSTNKELNTRVNLFVEEPIVLGSSISEELPTSKFYNGEYFIKGYRHKLSSNEIFSEFKLVRAFGSMGAI